MSTRTDPQEIPLHGGDVTEGVVRVGDTVRRPMRASSASVHAFLRHLEGAGFDGAPRVLGVDHLGREILTFVEGEVPMRPLPDYAVTEETLAELARLLRRFHDAAASFTAPPGAVWEVGSAPDDEPELIGHCDVTPENVVFREPATGQYTSVRRARPAPAVPSMPPAQPVPYAQTAPPVPYALIDFDMARPTTRLFDVLTTLRHWAPIDDPVDRDPLLHTADVGPRLRLFCDVYGLARRDRMRLLELARIRFHRSYGHMRKKAETVGGGWARMWANGAGARIRRAAAWLDANEDALRAHLL